MYSNLDATIDGLDFRFNGDKKKEFLRAIKDNKKRNTAEVYINVIRKIVDNAERDNDCEWMDFTKTMVDMAFRGIKATSEITLLTYLSVIKDYLLATTDETDEVKTGYDYTIQLERKDIKKFVNNTCEKYRYVTPKEFEHMMLERPGDPMSKAICILAYNGVKGDKFSDICEIQVDDINVENGEIFIRNKNEYCNIDMKYMDIFRQALKTTKYIVYDADGKITEERDLAPYFEYENRGLPKYFIRRNVYRTEAKWLAKPNLQLLAKRIRELSKGIQNPYIDCQSIYTSREVYRMLMDYDMQIPKLTMWEDYRKRNNSKISKIVAQNAARVLLEKLAKEGE